ncbi:MAG: cation:proton antiporter [Sulfurimonadaceae bacterium]|jgi:Kef-type K+ transport system membrane component KefB|nr:cation:proton antiporter [Sulfurimonadaceae bacterium]
MNDSSILFIEIALLLILSPIVSNLIRLPIVVVEIILGSLAFYFGFLSSDEETFKALSKIGFFYLIFLAGLEIDIKRFVAKKDTLLKSALIYFSTLYSLSFILYLALGLSPIYIVAIPIVSLGMIMALINEHGKEFKWLELVLIVGVMGEIVSISAIVMYESYTHHGVGFDLYKNIAIFFIVLFLVYQSLKLTNTLFWWFPELKESMMPQDDGKVQSVRISAAFFIIFVAIMHILHIDMVLGAFFAGIFISNFFEHKKDLPKMLHKVGFGFLVPIFFIYVGSTLDLTLVFSVKILLNALYIMLMIIFVRAVSSYVAYRTHLSLFETQLLALGDSMPLTFLIAIATIGYEANLISQDEYFSFIVAGMLSGVLIMSLLKFLIAKLYAKSK